MSFDDSTGCRCVLSMVARHSGNLLHLIVELEDQLPTAAQVLRHLASNPRARYQTDALCTAVGISELDVAGATRILNALARFGITSCINRTWGVATSQHMAESLAEQLLGAAVYAQFVHQSGESRREADKTMCAYARLMSAAA